MCRKGTRVQHLGNSGVFSGAGSRYTLLLCIFLEVFFESLYFVLVTTEILLVGAGHAKAGLRVGTGGAAFTACGHQQYAHCQD